MYPQHNNKKKKRKRMSREEIIHNTYGDNAGKLQSSLKPSP
jgi:hypothetical protein